MKRRKLAVLLAGVMTLSMVLAACGKTEPASKPVDDITKNITSIIKAEKPDSVPETAKNRKDTLVVGVDTPDGVFNPLYSESSYDGYIVSSIFNGLLDVDNEGNPIKGIAESWKISEDGLTYTFKMKKDVKFSDGTPVKASDVAFTYAVAADSSYSGVMDVPSMKLKGYDEYNSGKATTFEGVKAIDDNTVQFTLTEKNATAMYSFGVGILSQAYYGKDYKQGDTKAIEGMHQKPMGCGAYKLSNYKEGQEVDLVRNDSYWKGAPKIKNIIYRATTEDTRIPMLASGEIDMDMVTVKQENIDQIKEAGFLSIQMFPTNGYGYIGMNCKSPLFSDVKVRQALAYGLHRAEIVKAVYGEYANVQNVPTSMVGWTYTNDVEKYEYSIEKAKSLLDEAGWKVGASGLREKDGKKFEIHFTASTPNPVNDAIIPVAQKDYELLGIKFIPEQMDFNAVRAKIKKGDWEMYFMAWGLGADPDCSSIFTSKGSQNKTNYSNAKVDELCNKGLVTLDTKERKKVYQDLWKEINKDLPYIFMYQRRDMWVISARVQKLNCYPNRDFTNDLWQAELK